MPSPRLPTVPQACIVSYPKAGRTWLRVLIGKYLCDRHGINERALTRTEALTVACGLPRTMFMHGQSGFDLRIHWRELDPDRSRFSGARVVLLGRDIRDTLVSAYLWASRRLRIFDGPISAFVRDDYLGAPKLLAFYRHWHDARQVPGAFMFMRYEDLHRDPAGALARVLHFIGAPEPDEKLLAGAVAYASFENMRRIEEQRKLTLDFKMPEGAEQPSADPDSRKIRSGKVGGFAR